MKKTQNLHEYVREFKTAEKIALDKVRAEWVDLEDMHEDRNRMNLNYKIEDKTYKIHEEYIYGLFELIESKNPFCTREDAQTIANLLLKDFHISKWEFLKDCITGDIDR
jgi:hypothetical protein